MSAACGTRWAYLQGCRCDDCKDASRIYKRVWRTGDAEHGAGTEAKQRRFARLAELGWTDPMSMDWIVDAECRRHPTCDWYPDPISSGHRPSPEAAAALRVCRACPVQAECLAFAIAANEREHGIWGGLTPAMRRTRETWAVLARLTAMRQREAG